MPSGNSNHNIPSSQLPYPEETTVSGYFYTYEIYASHILTPRLGNNATRWLLENEKYSHKVENRLDGAVHFSHIDFSPQMY